MKTAAVTWTGTHIGGTRQRMAQWDDGYVTDVAYTSNFYREITPSLARHDQPAARPSPAGPRQPFSYADLGCGNGFTTLVDRRGCPHADVWGFDFNPAHVEFANGLAARAGLTNVRFRRDLVRRTATARRTASAGLRFHGVAWRAELDLAGEPTAPDRRGGQTPEAGRAGLSELQCHHRLDRHGAGAPA